MADEVDRTPAEAENDQTAMESALNTPVSDPALESVRVKIAAAADRKFQAAAKVRKEHETSVAEFEAQKAGFIDQVRKQAYQDYVNAGWTPPADEGEGEDEAAEGEAEADEEKPAKKPAAKSETVTIPKNVFADVQAQLKEQREEIAAIKKAAMDREEAALWGDFFKGARKYEDAFPDPGSPDPLVQANLNRAGRRVFAYWMQRDPNTGLRPCDRGVPLEDCIKLVAKENVAAQKAIDSRKKQTAPHPSQRGDATHEGPGAGGAIPEKLQKMDIDSKGFDTEVAKLLGNIGLE